MTAPAPRTAIVTGASRRVGAILASALIDDGWGVIAHAHNRDDPVPDGAIRVVADLADPDCGETIFAAAAGNPPVSLLVNCAARFAWDAPGELKTSEFDAHLMVNARAPALLIEALVRRHRTGDDACVINILDSKLGSPNADYLSYTISKQALAGLTDLYARALAREGIRVNAIAPGLMLRSSGQSEENFDRMHAANPLRRGVEPGDIADAARYLAGARCVTGQVLTIDSGHRFLGLDRDVQFLASE